jgi:hypothetical protein
VDSFRRSSGAAFDEPDPSILRPGNPPAGRAVREAWQATCIWLLREVAMGLVLLIVLVLLLLGAIPTWSYSRNWGYGPSGILGVILVVVVVLLLTGRL